MKRVFILISAIFFLLLTGCGGKETADSGMKTYTDTGRNFSIQYPSKWSMDTNSLRVAFLSHDDHAAIFITMYYNVPADEKIEDIFEAAIVLPYQKAESFQIGENLLDEEDRVWSTGIAEAAGAEAGYGGFFKAKSAGRDILMLVAVLKKGTTAYQVMTYAEKDYYEQYKEIFRNAFATFIIGE